MNPHPHSNIRTSLKTFNFLLMPVGCIYILKVIFLFFIITFILNIFGLSGTMMEPAPIKEWSAIIIALISSLYLTFYRQINTKIKEKHTNS